MIPSLLQRLSVARPMECRLEHSSLTEWYHIEGYKFWLSNNVLYAQIHGSITYCVGQPALDWLEGVVRRLIENTPNMSYDTAYLGKRFDRHCKLVYYTTNGNDEPIVQKYEGIASTLLEALLEAYLEYVEGK